MVFVVNRILKAFHLGTQTFTVTHVMGFAMTVQGIVTATNVIAEMVVVKTRRTYQPSNYLVDFLIRPITALASPPAERYAPAVEMLAHYLRTDNITFCILSPSRGSREKQDKSKQNVFHNTYMFSSTLSLIDNLHFVQAERLRWQLVFENCLLFLAFSNARNTAADGLYSSRLLQCILKHHL